MKHRTIRKIKLIVGLVVVSMATIIIILSLKEENYNPFIKLLSILILVEICFYYLKEAYKEYLTLMRKKCNRNKELNTEEIEIVKDAIRLIKSVDENIELAKFNVYKVKHIKDGWFDYDEDTHELNIFIPFDRYLNKDKDICFMIVLHEILHAQNLRLNEEIFIETFKEGMNQFLTLWLIDKYSKKYKVPKYIPTIIYFKLKTREIHFYRKQKGYKKEVKQAEKVIRNSDQNIKKIYLNYINLNPKFFENFVPEKYLIK